MALTRGLLRPWFFASFFGKKWVKIHPRNRLPGVLLLALNGFILPGPPARAQSLGTEIQGIEKTLETPGLSGADRRAALARLARLRELSGNIEAAARAWGEAAAAEPGKPDDESLLRGAFCLAAMGEWEQAAAPVRTILLAGRPGPSLRRARYLGAVVEALGSADFSALKSLADDPGFAAEKPAMYYILWKALGPGGEGERWKTRLLAEYPQSPEARAAGSGGGGAISAAPTPLWLLFPGRNSFAVVPQAAASPAAVPASAPVPAGRPAPAVPPASAAPSAATASPASIGGAATASPAETLLQTGLFGSRENAEKQAERLRAAGFSPLLTRRAVKGAEYWAVGVSSGPDMSRMILALKNAGFESFPVY
jgi:cell division septation protein DedD